MSENYKSGRKIKEEINQYRYDRFEKYMQMADDEVLTRELAIAAFRDEDTYLLWTGEQDDN